MKTFKTFLEESIIDNSPPLVLGFKEELAGSIVDLLYASNQLNIFHWQTGSHKIHVALEELYDGLREASDTLAEMFLGIGGNFSVLEYPNSYSPTFQYDDSSIKDYIEYIHMKVVRCISISETPEFMSFNGVFVDIQSKIQKSLYFLR